jgi:hypothetical protein
MWVHGHRAGVSGELVFARPMVYLLSQAIYFRAKPEPAGIS